MPLKIFAKSDETCRGNWLEHVPGCPGVDEALSLGAGGWGGAVHNREDLLLRMVHLGFRLMLVVHENKKGSRVGVG